MLWLSVAHQRLAVDKSCRERLLGSKVIVNLLADTGSDAVNSDETVIPLPEKFEWAVTNSYCNWLQARGHRINKAYKLVQALQLANFLEDDSYLQAVMRSLLDRWFYRDLASKVMSQVGVDLRRIIYLRLPQPFIPEHLRHNPAFIMEWMSKLPPSDDSSVTTADADQRQRQTYSKFVIMSLAKRDFATQITCYLSDLGSDGKELRLADQIRLKRDINMGCRQPGKPLSYCKITTRLQRSNRYFDYYHGGRANLCPEVNRDVFVDKANKLNKANRDVLSISSYYVEINTTGSGIPGIFTEYTALAVDNQDNQDNQDKEVKIGSHKSWALSGSCVKQVNYCLVTVTEGQYDTSVLHGESLHWYPNGQVYSTGHYNMGKQEGCFVSNFDNGRPRELSHYHNDVHDGLYQSWLPNIDHPVTMGYYDQGHKIGWWMELDTNHPVLSELVDVHIICGRYRQFDIEGIRKQLEVKDDYKYTVRCGQWQVYRPVVTATNKDGRQAPASHQFKLYQLLDFEPGLAKMAESIERFVAIGKFVVGAFGNPPIDNIVDGAVDYDNSPTITLDEICAGKFVDPSHHHQPSDE